MSEASIKAKIAMARKLGWTDSDILKAALANVYGATQRREIVVEWARYLGIEASDALRLAQAAHLLPSAAPPPATKKQR